MPLHPSDGFFTRFNRSLRQLSARRGIPATSSTCSGVKSVENNRLKTVFIAFRMVLLNSGAFADNTFFCPLAGRALTFSLDEKVSKKSSQNYAIRLFKHAPELFTTQFWHALRKTRALKISYLDL